MAEKQTDKQRAQESLDKIKGFGENILKDIKAEGSPEFQIPLRARTNVTFNPSTKTLELGDKTSTRSFINVNHTRKFMQSMLVSSACQEYITEDKTVGKRELYYNLKHTLPNSKENTFDDDIE